MTFKSRIWYPFAIGLTVANVIAVATAVGGMPPWHAMSHAVAALAFGLWAQRLWQRRREDEEQQVDSAEDVAELETEVNILRQELIEMQERVDFAERMLAQRPEERRIDIDRK